jgi:hypothetical protein
MRAEFQLAAGASELRSRFRAHGFGVPDVYAEIVSEICGGVRTPEAIKAEWDARALEYLHHGGRNPPTWTAADLEYREALGNRFMPETFHRRIDDRKNNEVSNLLAEWPGLIERKTQLREFAEAFAATRGFSVVRRSATTNVGRVLHKSASQENGCVGEIFIDVGGRSGAVWTSNQTTFYLGNRDGDLFAAPALSAVVPGIVYYGSAQPSYEVLAANRHQDPRPPEVVSGLIKLGVMGQIVFFDILLDLLSVHRADA